MTDKTDTRDGRAQDNGTVRSVRETLVASGWRDPSEKARTRGLSRRAFMRESGLASLAGVTATAGCLGGDDDAPLEVGYLPITDAAPLLAAYATETFQDHGVEVAEPTLFRGWADLAEAFLSGEVDLAHFLMPMTLWMRYGDTDADLNVVAWDHVDGSALTVRPDIQAWTDLGGTTVAVPFWYSIHNVILQVGLREHGLAPRTDATGTVGDDEVNLVVTPPPDMPAALNDGSIAGYIVAEPFNAIGEVDAGGRVLRFTGDIWRRHACCVVSMRESDVRNEPEWVTDVVSGVVDAQRWLRNNRSEAASLLSDDETGLYPQGPEIIERAMTLYGNHEQYLDSGAIQHTEWDSERIDFYPYPYRSYTKELTGQMKRTRVEGETAFLADIEPSFVADDLVAYGPVETALERAGGPDAFGVPDGRGYEREEQLRL